MHTRLITVTFLAALFCAAAVHSQDGGSSPCQSPEARQFDFWTGVWTVKAGDKVAGTNRISSIHNGCTLLEEYTGARGGYEGKSFNYFDPADRRWHQIWLDSSGLRLHLSGGYHDGKMVMSGKRVADGAAVEDRITWYNNADGTVRQLWQVSKDGGWTWKDVFDGMYTRAEE